MKKLRYLAAPMVALACVTAVAVAQTPAPEPTAVTIPWGDTLIAARDGVIAVVIMGLGFAMRRLPAAAVQWLTTLQVEQLFKRGLEYGFNATAGAVKGQTLTVDVGNAVLAQALQYIINRAPAWLVKWLGGQDGISEMLIARLDLGPGSYVDRRPNGPPILFSDDK